MHLLPLLLLLPTLALSQAIRGFNSGGTGPNGIKWRPDFKKEMERIHTLPGAPDFTSMRLFTMIQASTINEPVQVFRPALETSTKLLLGMWASAGPQAFANELTALRKAITTHGAYWKKIVHGICVGSEDLYRITPTGIANKAGIGAGPATLVDYIKQTRQILKGTPAEGTPICHVDTWTAWINGSNTAVIDAVDFLGFDGYPYYEKDTGINSIENSERLFFESYNRTVAVAKGKKVAITEVSFFFFCHLYLMMNWITASSEVKFVLLTQRDLSRRAGRFQDHSFSGLRSLQSIMRDDTGMRSDVGFLGKLIAGGLRWMMRRRILMRSPSVSSSRIWASRCSI